MSKKAGTRDLHCTIFILYSLFLECCNECRPFTCPRLNATDFFVCRKLSFDFAALQLVLKCCWQFVGASCLTPIFANSSTFQVLLRYGFQRGMSVVSANLKSVFSGG